MARGPCTFRQRDITRALKATIAAGVEVQRVEVEKTGKIVIVTGKPMGEGDNDVTSWDGALNDEAP